MKIQPVILSGGSGTRLWPLSREALPKQLLPLVSERTMLQETALRLRGIKDIQAPLVVCNQEHRFLVAEQMLEAGIKTAAVVLEPCGRNTAPAVAVAALWAVRHDPQATLLVLPADHLIADVAAFHQAVARAADVAESGYLATFGIVPASPETGYGYIQQGALIGDSGACQVSRFVEKPEQSLAETMLAEGGYYWNSGMFVFKAQDYLDELQSLRPGILSAATCALDNSYIDLDFVRLEPEAFAACPGESIDYAIMEHTNRAAVVPVSMGWNDIGSWSAIWEVGHRDPRGNHLVGDVIADDCDDCLVRSESRVVVGIGIRDLVIVETPDAIMVASRSRAQDVRNAVAQLKRNGRTEPLHHRRVYRPWGWYESIDDGERFQVKRIMVKPGAKLSLQKHHHRAEHWVVVSGTAQIIRGEERLLLGENESTFIPMGTIHRLENPGKIPLHIIEVQSGAYLAEDDIIRYEDDYARG